MSEDPSIEERIEEVIRNAVLEVVSLLERDDIELPAKLPPSARGDGVIVRKDPVLQRFIEGG